jgi:hypothetical protein
MSDVGNVKIALAEQPSAILSSQTRTTLATPQTTGEIPAVSSRFRASFTAKTSRSASGRAAKAIALVALRGHANGLGQAATPLTRIANKSSLSDGREIIAL